MNRSTFARSPFIAIRETTRACAKARLDRIAAFGDPPPLVVFTDPLAEDPGCAYQPAGRESAP